MKYAITLTIDDDEVQWIGSTRGSEPWVSKSSTDAALFVQKKSAETAAKDIAKSMWGQRATEISVVGVEFTIAEVHPIELVKPTGFVLVCIRHGGDSDFLYTGTKKAGTYSQLACFDSKSPGRATTFATEDQAEKRRVELVEEADAKLVKEQALPAGRNREVYIQQAENQINQMKTSRVINIADFTGDKK